MQEEYRQLLIEILQTEIDSGSDPQVVYPLLAQHQQQLDLTFAQTVTEWFQSQLDPDDPQHNQFVARTLLNFGVDISEFPLGTRAHNLEIAIACYQAALQVRTRQSLPQNWATTQNNLGIAYRNRIQGERGENIEQAIACYQAALQVRTRQSLPQYWATTQNNLGAAYRNRIQGERGENIERAIACYQAALQVRTRQSLPQDWAQTQNNLGNAYLYRIQGERGENIEQAIACYEAALQVYTRESLPQDWALTQENIAYAYIDLENHSEAIKYFKAALEVLTPASFPLNALKAGRNLGDLGYDLQDWETAIFGYDQAIRAVEQSRTWATSPATKRQLIEDALPLYGKLIQACLHLGRTEQALLTVERSKSRTLMELLVTSTLEPKTATPEQKQRYRQLQRDIAAGLRLRGIVVCPSTNLYLLGSTLNISALDISPDMLPVALGSDSRLTASGDLLDEIGPFAAAMGINWNQRVAQALAESARRITGQATTMTDFCALTKTDFPRRRADLALVVRDGVPRIGDPQIMATFPHVQTVACTLDGVEKRLHIELAKQIHRCTLKEQGLEVDELPAGRRFWFW